MNEWMNEWINKWMDEWMNEWMNENDAALLGNGDNSLYNL